MAKRTAIDLLGHQENVLKLMDESAKRLKRALTDDFDPRIHRAIMELARSSSTLSKEIERLRTNAADEVGKMTPSEQVSFIVDFIRKQAPSLRRQAIEAIRLLEADLSPRGLSRDREVDGTG